MARYLVNLLGVLCLLVVLTGCEVEEPENALEPRVGQWVSYRFVDHPDPELYVAITGSEDFEGVPCFWLEICLSGAQGDGSLVLAMLVEQEAYAELAEDHRRRIEQPALFEEFNSAVIDFLDRLFTFEVGEFKELFEVLLEETALIKTVMLQIDTEGVIEGVHLDFAAINRLLAREIPVILEMSGELLKGGLEQFDLEIDDWDSATAIYHDGGRETLDVAGRSLDCQLMEMEHEGYVSRFWYSTRVPLTGVARFEIAVPEIAYLIDDDSLTIVLDNYGFKGASSRLTLPPEEFEFVGERELSEGLAAVKFLLALGVLGQQLETLTERDDYETGEEMLERIIAEELEGPSSS